MKLEEMHKEAEQTLKLFRGDDREEFIFAPGQIEIYKIILARAPRYNHVITPTQYGKSLIIALGILSSAALGGHKWAIVAPSQRKTMIIMNYILKHAFDNIMFYEGLITETSLEKLRQERTKTRLVWKGGGEIFVVTANADNKKKAGEALMGFGAPNLAIDESSLLDDDIYATAIRMVGGSKDHFVIEIGNPFKRNHFLETIKDPEYNKVFIDYHQAIREGRMDERFINRMKRLPFFTVLYECLFPDEEAVDKKGFSPLMSDKYIKEAFERKVVPKGKMRLGVDIGRGGDPSAFVLRWNNYIKVLEKNGSADTMYQVKRIIGYIRKYELEHENVFVDDIGVGGGVTDRLLELDYAITPVRVGDSAQDSERYKNLRAELHWEAKLWFEQKHIGAEEHLEFYDLSKIRYKEDTSSRLQLEPKNDLKKRIGRSPDVADAAVLTFAPCEDVPELYIV